MNKAVREAMDEMKRNMQSLQSAESSPRRSTDNIRWSLDEGRHVSETSTTAPKTVETLEQRNKELAMILQGALKEMDRLILDINKSKETALKDVMTIIGSVKECLEDSRLPIPKAEEAVQESTDDAEGRTTKSPDQRKTSNSSPISKSVEITLGLGTPAKDITLMNNGGDSASTATDALKSSSPPSKASPVSPSMPGSRPTLADSSFAWMLGESDLRSSFVASFPTPATERRQSRHGKTGYLFGNSTDETSPSPEDQGRGDSLIMTSWGGESRDG